MRCKRGLILIAFTFLTILAVVFEAAGQQIHRHRFESSETAFEKGPADTKFRELIHEITDSTARSGQFSEHLQITCDTGSHVYYQYPIGKAPLTEDLNVSLWIKANRPGIQILARLVLPRERNPQDLQEPVTTLLRGDVYQDTSRWRRLDLRRPMVQAKQQQQLMRARLQREVDFTDAYVDRILINVYGGPGLTEIWVDDLEAGPVLDAQPFQTTSRPRGPVRLLTPESGNRKPLRPTLVEMDRGQLTVNGKRFFIRGIRHSDTPLKALRDAGFNAVWFDRSASPRLTEEAVGLGLWLVPHLTLGDSEDRSKLAAEVKEQVAGFNDREAILFWDLGGGLTQEQSDQVAEAIRQLRSSEGSRPVAADIWDGFRPYSRSLDLLGVHRWPLMTGLEIRQYRRWLDERRLLSRPGIHMWTWVQTHLPDWYTNLVYGRSAAAGFDDPIGPQPEQIRLLTYAALAAGCKGLGFWSDRFLADSHQGRDRLLTLALLNQEIRLLEPLLTTADEPASEDLGWLATSQPDVWAAVLRTKFGLLVLPMWLGQGAQFVPGQAATANLSLVVPQVPVGTQAWEVSPAEVRCLKQERVAGGTKVVLPEFGLTSAIVFTADNGPNGIVVRFQDQVRQTARIAAQWSQNLAEEEIGKVARIYEQLERQGQGLPDGPSLLADARKRSRASAESFNRGKYRESYLEAQRALRPLRILTRAQWESALRSVNGLAVASPYALSYYTLPMHGQFMDKIRQARPGRNLLNNGDFELSPEMSGETWALQQTTLDEVVMTTQRVTDSPRQGRYCLMLDIKPMSTVKTPQAALERTFLAVRSPLIRVKPGALMRISGWMRIPKDITASVDGALLYDTAADEPLAVRLTKSMNWKQFILYRRAPADGSMGVMLALTGIGTVFFDDVHIEALEVEGEQEPVARQ